MRISPINHRPLVALACLAFAAGCRRNDAEQKSIAPPAAPTTAQAQRPDPVAAKKSEHEDLDDADISRAVREAFARDPGLDPKEIRVKTEEGIVELTGTVRDLLSKRRATRIAETVRGVRAVSDRTQLIVATRPDAAIQREVETALLSNAATDSYEVAVTVSDGIVSLNGTVQSAPERELAARVAEGVRGVRGVHNELAIAYAEERRDAQILADVQSRLRWDALVQDGLMQANVKSGEVSLNGVVGSAAEKRRAESDAWVAGVKSVNDDGLAVEWWAENDELRKSEFVDKPDTQIASAIRDAAAFDPRVESGKLVVSVSGGIATISGPQETTQAKLAAEALARNTLGVVAVRNRIVVEPGKAVSDSEIAKNVRLGLIYNPVTEAFGTVVKAHGGVVTLDGTVDTSYERAAATDVAAGVNGVRRVDNELKVREPEVPYVYNWYLDPYEPYVDHWRYTPSTTLRSDEALESEIRQELSWNPLVDRGDVNVAVVAGAAILTGVVDSYAERTAAADSAFDAGALTVDNRLAVAKHD